MPMVYNRPLRLDQVIASQKELGPSPPDGGYGWIVLIACVFIQLTIPSLITAYGVFLLFDQIENLYHDNAYYMWDHEITLVPIVYLALWTLTDAWCHRITRQCQFPKLVVFCGLCLIVGGNLVIWGAEHNEPTIILFYFIGGGAAGIGSSMIITQSEFLIRQYFQEKYKVAKNILYLSQIIGYILTPLILGNLIIRHGVLECMIVHQFILAQVLIVALAFRKPDFTVPQQTAYNLLDTTSLDDEHLVFNKAIVEVQSSTSANVSLDVEIRDANRKLETFRSRKTPPVSSRIQQDNIQEIQPSPRNRVLQHSFSNDFSENDTFSYDNSIDYNSIVGARIGSGLPTIIEEEVISVKKEPIPVKQILRTSKFYKFLLIQLAQKLSHLIFWSLYPSMVHNDISLLNVHQAYMCLTFVAIGGLVFTIVWNCLVVPGRFVNFLLAMSFFLLACGFTIIHMTVSKSWILFGGIISTASFSSIHVLVDTLLLQNKESLGQTARSLINGIVGTAILATTIFDIEYWECFETGSFLLFLVGASWWTNIIYKRLKKTME